MGIYASPWRDRKGSARERNHSLFDSASWRLSSSPNYSSDGVYFPFHTGAVLLARAGLPAAISFCICSIPCLPYGNFWQKLASSRSQDIKQAFYSLMEAIRQLQERCCLNLK